MISWQQTHLAAHLSLFTITRQTKPFFIAVIIYRVENFKQQGSRHICSTEIGYAGTGKISHPYTNCKVFIKPNAPGIPSSITGSCFPGDLWHMFGCLPVQGEIRTIYS